MNYDLIVHHVNYVLDNLDYSVVATIEERPNALYWSLGGRNSLTEMDDSVGMLENYQDEIRYWKTHAR